MSTQTHEISIEDLKARTDCRTVAARYTRLRRHTDIELCGPCPICRAGDDRFFVRRDWWGCRVCNTGGDVIRLVELVERVSFPEALHMLAEQTLTAPAPIPPRSEPPPRQTAAWTAEQAELLKMAQDGLPSSPGAAYLSQRGLTPDTWTAFGLGYCATRNAIAMPWYRGGYLWGVRYRLLDPRPGTSKAVSAPGSILSGYLFGGQAFPLPLESEMFAQRTLFIVEGELNAMSVWQVAEAARCDVLSTGGRSFTMPPAIPPLAARYRAVIVWMDSEEDTRKYAAMLPNAYAFWSEYGEPDAKGKRAKRDANDHLQAGTLWPLLRKLMERATPAGGQEGLRWDLWDAENGFG